MSDELGRRIQRIRDAYGDDAADMGARIAELGAQRSVLGERRAALDLRIAGIDEEIALLEKAASPAGPGSAPPGVTDWKTLLDCQPETDAAVDALNSALREEGWFYSVGRNEETGQRLVTLALMEGDEAEIGRAAALVEKLRRFVLPEASGHRRFNAFVDRGDMDVTMYSRLLVAPSGECVVDVVRGRTLVERREVADISEALHHLLNVEPSHAGPRF